MGLSPEEVLQQCQAARKDCVFFLHSHRAVIEVKGADRIHFLHNVLSNDIKRLAPNQGTTACLLNPQGKIIANMNVLYSEKAVWLCLDYEMKNKLMDALKKLVVAEDVKLTDLSESLKRISI